MTTGELTSLIAAIAALITGLSGMIVKSVYMYYFFRKRTDISVLDLGSPELIWNPELPYMRGNKVTWQGIVYVAAIPNRGVTPGTNDTTCWIPLS